MIECRGAIAWDAEAEGDPVRVDTLQIASSAAAGADRIAVYAAERDFSAEDVLACADGVSTAQMVTGTGATTSVINLTRGLGYGSGRVQYDLDTVFTIVSTSSGAMVVGTTTGRGGFICDAELPSAIARSE